VNIKVHAESVAGDGAWVQITNPVKGTVWLGEVLRWTLGDPQVRVYGTGEVRYFPQHWITEVDA
jgi:hypothetical protein